jgi:hypothetical protein
MDKIEAYFKNSYNFYKLALEILTYSQVNYSDTAIHLMDKYINLELACVHTDYFDKEDMMDAIIDMDQCKNGMNWTAASWILEKYVSKMEFFCQRFGYPIYEIDTELESDTDTENTEFENEIVYSSESELLDDDVE